MFGCLDRLLGKVGKVAGPVEAQAGKLLVDLDRLPVGLRRDFRQPAEERIEQIGPAVEALESNGGVHMSRVKRQQIVVGRPHQHARRRVEAAPADALHIYDVIAIELHDGVVGLHLGKFRLLVGEELLVLLLAGKRQGLDYLPDEAGQVALRVRRVLALDGDVGDEREVVANEHARAEAYRDGKRLSWLFRSPTVAV